MAKRFHFTQFTLPDLPGKSRIVRTVHPEVERLSAWMSSTGAAVALGDLDNDGLSNDLCHVDPRWNKAQIEPVPGTGERYPPFILDPRPLHVDSTMELSGCLIGDFNEDGYRDIVITFVGRSPIIFLRKGPGPLAADSFVPREIVTPYERYYTLTIASADINGDGHVDLIVGNYFGDDARLFDPSAPHVSEKGVMHSAWSKSYNGGLNRLYIFRQATTGPDADIHFDDVRDAWDENLAREWTVAIGAADLDGDLLPELYVANDFGPDQLLHNRSKDGKPSLVALSGRTSLTTPASFAIGHDTFKSMGTDFADLNHDGYLDIYVSNLTSEWGMVESHFVWMSTGKPAEMQQGIAPYEQRSEDLGLARSGFAWDSRLIDFDNDGEPEALQATGFVKGDVDRWPEMLAIGTSNDEIMSNPEYWPSLRPGDDVSGHQPNAFFVKHGDGRYYDIAAELGVDSRDVSRGIACADVDGDGDLDYVVANQFAPSVFYRNDAPAPGKFLGLHLEIPVTPRAFSVHDGHPARDELGRPAIGAAATLIFPDGRKMIAQVDGGNGHSGKRSPELFFGLGQIADGAAVRVELRWRDGSGKVRARDVELKPGWHTVTLGGESEG